MSKSYKQPSTDLSCHESLLLVSREPRFPGSSFQNCLGTRQLVAGPWGQAGMTPPPSAGGVQVGGKRGEEESLRMIDKKGTNIRVYKNLRESAEISGIKPGREMGLKTHLTFKSM